MSLGWGVRVLGGGLIVVRCSGPWSSLARFALGVCEIVGSNPTGPTIKKSLIYPV